MTRAVIVIVMITIMIIITISFVTVLCRCIVSTCGCRILCRLPPQLTLRRKLQQRQHPQRRSNCRRDDRISNTKVVLNELLNYYYLNVAVATIAAVAVAAACNQSLFVNIGAQTPNVTNLLLASQYRAPHLIIIIITTTTTTIIIIMCQSATGCSISVCTAPAGMRGTSRDIARTSHRTHAHLPCDCDV